MTAPERRRPLPALAFIAALTVLTALVWFRVIHRTDATASAAKPSCTTTAATPARIAVLPVPGKVTVAVLNATNRQGLAKRTQKLLRSRGFVVSSAADDSTAYGGHGPIKGVGEIRFGPSARAAATLLHYYLPTAKQVQTDSSLPSVYLAVGAKFTTVRTAKVVQKALTASRTTLTRGTLPSTSVSPSPSC